MEFHVVHEIAASRARIEAAVLDAGLLRRLPAFTSAVAEAHELTRHDHGDRVEREVALDAALDRMARPSAEIIRGPWIDTRPMVQGGATTEESPRS